MPSVSDTTSSGSAEMTPFGAYFRTVHQKRCKNPTASFFDQRDDPLGAAEESFALRRRLALDLVAPARAEDLLQPNRPMISLHSVRGS